MPGTPAGHPPAYAERRNGSIEQKDSSTLQAEFRYRVAFTAGLLSSSPRNQCEGFRPFNGVYQFLHIQMSSWRRNEAKTIRWDPSDRVLDRFDI